MDIWQGIQTIAKVRGTQVQGQIDKHMALEEATLNLELKQNLDLFLDGSIENIAPIMCQCLEDKFINDMDLENPL